MLYEVNGPDNPCPFCGRVDVPICPKCKQRVPHGMVVGTWLPCTCQGDTITLDRVLNNAKLEVESESKNGKEVKS
jgi:hypothetical protein